MVRGSFVETFKNLRLSRKYIAYSILFGLTNLIVPIAVQFLVNNLALSGIWINIVGFVIIIGVGLTISQILKHCQIVLKEYLEREVFSQEVKNWNLVLEADKSIYFTEIFFSMKSFSKSFTSLVEIILVTFLGLFTIIIFHPLFLILPLILFLFFYQIKESNKPALQTSINESNEKYRLLKTIFGQKLPEEHQFDHYLKERNEHFHFIKLSSIKISALYVICQILLLGGGTWLVETQQLSIGQLVSAEIILSGILVSLNKLPETLESIYDYETSVYKLKKAKGVH